MSQNIMIAGGASGIGRATAEGYLKNQNKVTIFDINHNHITDVQQSNMQYSDSLLTIVGDVRNSIDINRAINQSINTFGDIDVLVYSAGVFPDHHLLNMEEEDWDIVLDINLKGAFLFCQKVAQRMIKNQTKGHILTVSSGSYRSARVGSGHYCASKAGLVMLTKVMAMEFAKHEIKVNSIAPGLIDNPQLDSNYIEQFVERIPAGRIGTTSDISSFIVSLTTLNNSYLTGQVIAIDGALSTGQYGLMMSNKQ